MPRDQAGWMLNRGNGCVFFSRDAEGKGVCDIYETRPLCCRLFNCDTDERGQEFRRQAHAAETSALHTIDPAPET